MLLIRPSFGILTPLDGEAILKTIEVAGRTCYKSEGKITLGSAQEFCRRIMQQGHLSVIEHVSFSVRFIANRGFTHELVRHRLASYSQESTRYCDYAGEVAFVLPPWVTIGPGDYRHSYVSRCDSCTDRSWFAAMAYANRCYDELRSEGWSPQQARGVLPIDLKTEIVMTANLREWRHVFQLRCSKAAHPQMRELMIPLQDELKKILPEVFGVERASS